MHNHPEYHRTATGDTGKEVDNSSETPVTENGNLVRGNRRCGLLLIGAVIIIALCVHPQILSHRIQEETFSTEQLLLRSSDNDSMAFDSLIDIRKELLEVVSPQNVYEYSYIYSLSHEKLKLLLQLRSEVADQLTKYYMRRATYLSTWLRAKDWVVEDAKEMLLDHLEWRIEYEIDSVMDANFTYFETELPYNTDGVDKTGGPVLSFNIEDWDLRKVLIGGDRKEFLRYNFRMFETIIEICAEAQDSGENFSQGMLIMNLNKYSYAKHGCFLCLSVFRSFLFGTGDNYPGWLHHIILINSSELAETLVDVMVPYLNEENRAVVEVYGFNRVEWQKKILSLVDADQLRPEFGGIKVDSHEV